MIIMKFGGSSLANAERIRHVTKIVRDRIDQHPIIVLSAMGKTTNELLAAGENAVKGTVDIKAIRELHLQAIGDLKLDDCDIESLFDELERLLTGISLVQEVFPRLQDYLVSFGERLAVRIFAAHLTQVGQPARAFDAWTIGMTTTSDFTNASVLEESYPKIAEAFCPLQDAYTYLPVVTGFIGKDHRGSITTLGRGGSDLTASIIGAAVGASEIQVWKDVDGILTTDPRLVPDAIPVEQVSFDEAAELAYFGAKVLHPISIRPAMSKDIPVRVKNSYRPEHPGTLILRHIERPDHFLTAISVKQNVTLVDIQSTRMLGQYGFLNKVFQVFSDLEISVDVIATSEVSISLTLDNSGHVDHLQRELEKIAHVKLSYNKAIVSLISNVKRASELLSIALRTCYENGINVQMISHGASKVNTALIIEGSEAKTCVEALHKTFFGVKK